MTNQPMVFRGFRTPEQLWDDAMATAERRGEKLPAVIRARLEEYVKEDS